MRSRPGFKPDSSEKQNKENDSSNCLWMVIATIGSYFVLMAINRVWAGYGSRLDHIICYGVLIGFAVLVIFAMREAHQDGKKLREAQRDWKNTCKSAEVAIVDRQYSPGGVWEDGYGDLHNSHSRYQLNVALTAEQRVLFPNLPSVNVDVDEKTYSRLIHQNVVRIYYRPDSPMVFLLEEEIG